MATTVNPTVVLAAAGLVVLFLAGVFLTWRGFRGRRVGREPRCRRCGYDLTGTLPPPSPEIDPRCPECGTPASGRNVVLGVRRRRRLALAGGLTLLVLLAAGAGTAAWLHAKRIGWRTYAPVFVLRYEARMDAPLAIAELTRRYQAGSITADALLDLVPLALQRFSVRPEPLSMGNWVLYMAALESGGQLTPGQSCDFRDSLSTIELTFRPRIRREDVPHVGYHLETRGLPALSGDWTIRDGVLQIGDQWFDLSLPDESFSRRRSGTSTVFGRGPLPSGEHDVVLRGTKVFHNPDFARPFARSGKLTVLALDAADPLRLVPDRTVERILREAISIKVTEPPAEWRPLNPGDVYVDVIAAGPIPVNCAFEVLARIGEREVSLHPSYVIRKNDSRRCMYFSRPGFGADVFVPIFRTSAAAARETPDLFEIWDGELALDPVTISRPGATQRAP